MTAVRLWRPLSIGLRSRCVARPFVVAALARQPRARHGLDYRLVKALRSCINAYIFVAVVGAVGACAVARLARLRGLPMVTSIARPATLPTCRWLVQSTSASARSIRSSTSCRGSCERLLPRAMPLLLLRRMRRNDDLRPSSGRSARGIATGDLAALPCNQDASRRPCMRSAADSAAARRARRPADRPLSDIHMTGRIGKPYYERIVELANDGRARP